MALEKWIAVASIGLFAMFVGELVSVYHFILEPPEQFETAIIFEPDPKILQFISIGVAPACVMAAVSFIMSKRYGSKQVGMLILGGGVILLVGMVYCYTLIDKVHEAYIGDAVSSTPLVFMLVSIPVIVFGSLLFRIKKKRPTKDLL